VRHLRDLPVPELCRAIGSADEARRVSLKIHREGATSWDALGLGRQRARILKDRFRFGPLLDAGEETRATDGAARKYLFRAADGAAVEAVLIRNLKAVTLCLSSQAGCALGCTFCATAALGLRRNLSAGEITEAVVRVQRHAGVRVSDVVFMGQGEPLHNYDAVLQACATLHHHLGPCLSRKRITISTAGLTPQILRFARERHRWRLHLSLHSAVQETRERLMPVARHHPLPGLLAAMREYQRACDVAWVTLQYVALPGVNMDQRHVDALATGLRGLRYILNVIPWNDTGGPFRPPTWQEVREFTGLLRALRCPVKVRYSAGKREGMGCGQLTAETLAFQPTGGHLLAPPGIFTD